MRNLLLIFVKNPILGKVKTRLAADVGEERALEVYKKLLETTRSATDNVKCIKRVCYSEQVDLNDLWNGYEKFEQQGVDLGERMHHAFTEAFEIADRVVIIGSDCPAIAPDIIEGAFSALENFDVVLGPATDGGYYLLGMNSLHPALFQEVPWSSDAVFQTTMDIVRTNDLTCHTLEQLSDVDTVEDIALIEG